MSDAPSSNQLRQELREKIGFLGRENSRLAHENAELSKDEKRLNFLMSAFNDQSPDAWRLLQSLRRRKTLSRELVDEAMEGSAEG